MVFGGYVVRLLPETSRSLSTFQGFSASSKALAAVIDVGQNLGWMDSELLSSGKEVESAIDSFTVRKVSGTENNQMSEMLVDESPSDSSKGPANFVESATYAPILRQCGNANALSHGKRIHADIVKSGHGRDLFLLNLLIQMYGKCGALQDARATFDIMHKRNVFSWTIMIGVYAEHGQANLALLLFKQMQPAGVTPNKVTLVTVISICAGQSNLNIGKLVHSCIEGSSFETDVTVGNALVYMYDKCGSLEDAHAIFTKMAERNVISWNAMIAAYAHHGQHNKAHLLFLQMQLEDVMPDNVTFINILDLFTSPIALREAKRMHTRIVVSGFETDVIVGTAIVSMYGKCGTKDDACRMFEKLSSRTTVSWNAMLAVFEEQGHGKEVLQLFQQMDLEGMIPDKITYVILFSACASQAALADGKRVHTYLLGSGFEWDGIIWNALVNMYAKCGCLESAVRLSEETPRKDVVSWNSIIAAYTHHEQGQEALRLFQQMQLEGELPSKVTYVSVVDACGIEGSIVEGKRVHSRIVNSGLIKSDVIEENALVNMYGKCGSVEDAWGIFDKMYERDVISWTAMAAVYALHGHTKKALGLLEQMQLEGVAPNKVTFVSILDACANQSALAEGKEVHSHIRDVGVESDLVIGNALVNMYSKCHSLEDARFIFDKMPKRDVISWTVMAAGYAGQGHGQEALLLFRQMEMVGIGPNKISFISILEAFASQNGLVDGKLIHSYLVGSELESDLQVNNAILSLYGKCGSLENAKRVFDRMSERSVISWTAMISTYAHHGQGENAFKLYQEMQLQGIRPNKVTLVNILSACSHAGLVDEGCQCFTSMSEDYGITPTVEHYNCMIDLFGRMGKLEEGQNMINKMPMKPSTETWMTLLGACRMHLDVGRGSFAAGKVFELDPENATPYVLLSNLYVAAGRLEDAVRVRMLMVNKGLKKVPGCSSIVVKDKVHEFWAGDVIHPQTKEIHAELKWLSEQMRKAGYAPERTMVSADVEGEGMEDGLNYHSERLAIAFGLISTPAGSPLTIIKNLRVCPGCHSATKFISKIVQRDIVVRDSHRFHHFKDGICSCSDYW